MSTLPLREALKHGAVVAAANWPVVLIDYALEAVLKFAVAVPILGGAIMVTAIAGSEPALMMGDGLRTTADLVIGSLATAPVALTAFFAAMAVAGLGGQAIVFVLKMGTLTVLVASDRMSPELHAKPVGAEAFRSAWAYSLERIYDGTRRFGRRGLTLTLWLGGLYLIIGGLYLGAAVFGLSVAAQLGRIPAWPLLMFVATAVGVVCIAAINLAFELLRVIVVTDDCKVGQAVTRLGHFVVQDSRQVIGIFSVMGGLLLIATVASLFAAAGLAVVAWMPYVGLVVVPLQAAAWVMRGLGLEYMELSALAAYQTQYRRFSTERPSAGGVIA